MDNPWKLNATEAAVMQTLAMTGSNKAVAAHLAVDVKRVENLLYSIYKKMRQSSRVLAVLEWDRWARGHEGAR